jgi:hypothetical protein
MANFAGVEIIITSIPILDEFIVVSYDNPSQEIGEVAKSFRTNPGEFEIAGTTNESAFKLSAAIGIDYLLGGLLASYPLSKFTDSANSKFYLEATEYGHSFAIVAEPSWATITVTPEVPPAEVFEIGNITVSEADGVDKCGTARYDFTVNNDVPADFPVQILQPVSKIAATVNDLFFDYERFPVPQVNLVIESNQSAQDTKILPRISTYSFDSVDVVESFSGATITLNTSLTNIGDLTPVPQFSIDDISYQSSNVFYGILPGSYIAYVLDELGCKKSLPFTVVGVPVDKPEPIFNIVNANSLKYFEKQSVAFDGKTTFPNFDNSQVGEQLYFNTESSCYFQKAQTNDIITTQIQTNYDNIVINVRRLSDDVIVLTPTATEVVPNILQKDKRDCKIKTGASGKTNIYFPGGNTYAPDTLDISGGYTNTNLLLPEFADPGTIASGITVTLSENIELNGTFVVEDDVYDDDINGQAFQINAVFTASPTDAIVQSLYNALDYNIWEFSVNWGALELPPSNYYIQALGTDDDPRYDNKEWLSEPINSSAEIWKQTTYIEYSNSENFADMDYSTDIVNMIRVPARFVKYRNGGEKEVFEDSQGRIEPIKEVIVRDITLETSLMPQYLQEKIEYVIGHDTVKINGLEGNFLDKSEIEDLLDEQNRNYKSVAVFRLNETTTITDTSGVVGNEGVVLGADSGFVIGV